MKPKVSLSFIACVAAATLVLAGCSGAAENTTVPGTTPLQPPTTTNQAPATTFVPPTSTNTPALPTTPVTQPPATTSTPPATTSPAQPPATTSAPPVLTSAPTATSAKPLGGEAPLLKSHPAGEAFTTCLSCHLDTIKPSPVLHQVNLRHGCDQCHARTPMPETIGHEDALINMIPDYEVTCLVCHDPASAEHKE